MNLFQRLDEWWPHPVRWMHGAIVFLLFLITALGVQVGMQFRQDEMQATYVRSLMQFISLTLEDERDAARAVTALAQWDSVWNARHSMAFDLSMQFWWSDPSGQMLFRSVAFPSELVERAAVPLSREGCHRVHKTVACWQTVTMALGPLTVVYPGTAWPEQLRVLLPSSLVWAGGGWLIWGLTVWWTYRVLRRYWAGWGQWWAQRSTEEWMHRGASEVNAQERSLLGMVHSFQGVLDRMRERVEREHAFIETAAHELRTPLAVLAAQTHLLMRAQSMTQQGHAVAGLDRAMQRMQHTAEQLLSWSKLGASAMSSHPASSALDIIAVVRECLLDLSNQALAQGMTLTLEAPETWYATTDALALTCVVRNLVDNAIRYGRQHGTVTVSLDRLDGGHARLTVEDDGPGIAPELREAVFNRFFRGPTDQEGTGLGLAIVKQALSRLNGSITLETGRTGRGCLFTVMFTASSAEPDVRQSPR